jgi:hypothetical protein
VKDEIVEGDLALLEQDGGEGRAVAVEASAERDVDVRQQVSGIKRF